MTFFIGSVLSLALYVSALRAGTRRV